MTKQLLYQALVKFVLGAAAVGICIFFPAGTLHYWNAWLLMGILFVPMFLMGIVLMWKNPALLKKRLHAKETQAEQNLVMKLSGLMFLAGFILAGLDFRFAWITLPDWIS